MLVSKIEVEDSTYINLHAEESINRALFQDTENRDSFFSTLTSDTLIKVKNSKLDKTKFLVLDFINISNCVTNLLPILSEIISNFKGVKLLNIKQLLIDKIRLDIYSNNEKHLFEIIDGYKFFTEFHLNLETNYATENTKEEDYFNEAFSAFISQNTTSANKIPNYSSSVYLNKYIDVKKMISSSQSFFLYCLYKLSFKLKNHKDWLENTTNKPILVCQNINSSYIASIISSFLNLDVLILDKLGPINNLYNNLNEKIISDKNYLVVSDVVCLGTEVKIAKNLIEYSGGSYIGNISIVRIETFSEKNYSDNEYIFKIDKNNNPIEIKILTDLI